MHVAATIRSGDRAAALALRCGAVWLGIALVAGAVAGCAARLESPAQASCVPQPLLFDWQRLDERNVLLWPQPAEIGYHLMLTESLDGLRTVEGIAFADGNRDGLLCADGFDSLVITSPTRAAGGGLRNEATIGLISAVNTRAVESLRQRYTDTRGPRLRGSDSSL